MLKEGTRSSGREPRELNLTLFVRGDRRRRKGRLTKAMRVAAPKMENIVKTDGEKYHNMSESDSGF